MKNKSAVQHAFALVPSISKPRSVFNRNRSYKTTFDCDYLIPFYHQNILPGDSVKLRHSLLLRMLSPALKPIMDNMYCDWFYFFVPYRLVWTNFVKFMGEQNSPADSISYTVPQCTGPNVASGGIAIGSLHDYLGLPVGALSGGGGSTGITFNNLVPRSYNKIYMDFFKDQTLQNAITLDLGDGPDTFSNYNLLKRGNRHDYFTSCLPWAQKGGTAVTLPLGTQASIYTAGTDLVTGSQSPLRTILSTGASVLGGFNLRTSATGGNLIESTVANATGSAGIYPSNLYADLTTASAASINSIRQAITLQQFLENDARGGTRYTEIVKQRFGVTSPDMRLQRSELLALGSFPVNISPVAQTAPKPASGTTTAAGDLTAFGTASNVGNGFTKSFTEHGTVIGLLMVRADLNYQQGIQRNWFYRTRYDFYNPEFANLGEQAVLNKEIYANVPDGTGAAQKDGVFGYQERYAEERYAVNLITGNLRSYNGNSVNANTLDVYHLATAYSALPTLGDTFIKSQVPLDRCVAVPTAEHFILDAYISQQWARVMPMFSVPGLTKL